MMPTVGHGSSFNDVSTNQNQRYKAQVLACCILGILFLTLSIAWTWDHKYSQTYYSEVTQNDDDSTIDDDGKRDDVCKDYLMKFLNGTTDARDECEGMLNAYEAADCRDFGGGDNSFIFDNDDDNEHAADDVLIDDAYEAWECCSSIYRYYTRNCHTPDLASFQLLAIVVVLVLCGLATSLIQALEIMWIPDAAACVVVGATVGGTLKLISPRLSLDNNSNNFSSFNNNLFLHILLPPIIFASALKIDKRAFWKHIGPILMLAIVGTAMSAILIGLTTFGLSQIPGHSTKLPLLDSLLFGALASSIDLVATLGILDSVGISRTDTLYALVFGESLLNDGVAIVLFESLVRHVGDFRSKASLQDTCLRFLVVCGSSLGIGIACGFLCFLYYLVLRNKHPPMMEVSIFFCWALIPYYVSDAFGLSGIISIMAAGFVMDYYVIGGCQLEEAEWMDYLELECLESPTLTERHGNHRRTGFIRWIFRLKHLVLSGRGCMSARSSRHVGFVSEVIATLMETAIFAYLGVFLFSDKYMIDIRLNATAVFSCVVSRAVMVVMLGLVLNVMVRLDLKRKIMQCLKGINAQNGDSDDSDGESTIESSIASEEEKIYLNKDTQMVLFLSGVRGAVSFALVENLPVYNALTRKGSAYKAELKAMTSSSILFTLFVFGAATYFQVKHTQRQQISTSGIERRRLTQRLLSQPLASFDEDEDASRDTLSLNNPNR